MANNKKNGTGSGAPAGVGGEPAAARHAGGAHPKLQRCVPTASPGHTATSTSSPPWRSHGQPIITGTYPPASLRLPQHVRRRRGSCWRDARLPRRSSMQTSELRTRQAKPRAPSPSNAGNKDVDGKRRMSQCGTTAPPRENGEQAPAELPGRKARVSVRARSEAPMISDGCQ